MAFDLLPSLRPRVRHAVVRVRVCRKWEFRGGTDDGPISHLDLVLVDEKGNNMYGEIPATEAEKKGPLLEEGNIYVIRRFLVSNAKSTFRPVPGNYMIQFTCRTLIEPVTDSALVIPQFVYHLLPFDVLGVLVEISDPKVVHPSGKQTPTLTRDIVLRDLSHYEIKVTLWGQRASAFTLDNVYDPDEAKPIVVLLVGTLVKTYQGQNYLSGNAACRWYFNPDIPEANAFCSRYKLCFVVTDGTAEAEMVCFADVATKIVGKPVQQVMRATRPSEEFPPDIAAVVSLSFTFAVVLADQSFEKPKNSYRVLSILASHGRNSAIPHSAPTNVASQSRAQYLPRQNTDGGINLENAEVSDETEIPITISEQQATAPPPTMTSQVLQPTSHPAAHTATPAVADSTPPSGKLVAAQSGKKNLQRDSSAKNTRTIARKKLLLSTDTDLQETVPIPSGAKRSKTQQPSAALQIGATASQSKKSVTPDDDAEIIDATSDAEVALPNEHS
ncbi:hypothetical protein BS78_09G089300 [Paspalum vaginatum]|nr:hypothetical protein BS78_09G089300 [Paspalum vaginatum]